MWTFKKLIDKASYVLATMVLLGAQVVPVFMLSGTAQAAGAITFGSQFQNQTFPNDPNTWTNGSLSNYSEGDYINFRYVLNATDATSAGTMQIEFDLSSCNFFTDYFNVVSVVPAIATVTESTQALIDPNGANNSFYRQDLSVSFNTSGTTTVIFTLRLSNTAGECNGSNTGVRLAVPDVNAGDFANAGAKTLPMSSNEVLINPSITITKTVNGGTAVPSDFSFTVSPAINGQSVYTIPANANSVTITEVNPDGVYAITESGPAGYVFSGGTGTNCVVTNQSGVMTATVTAGRPSPTNAQCNFTNQFQTGTIIIEKQTLPDGDTTPFTFNPSYGSSFNLADGQTNNSGALAPGTYSVSETVPAGWDLTSTVCSDGSLVNAISLQANETVTCTFTNTKRGQLIVQKTTAPAQDPTEFSVAISTTNGSVVGDTQGTVSDATDKTFVVRPGTYSVTETVPQGWSKTADTCQNVVVSAGETKYCELTNTKLGSISGTKYEVNAEGSLVNPSTGLAGWTIDLYKDSVKVDSTVTDSNGDYFFSMLMPGNYEVVEILQTGWTQITPSGDGDHDITLSAGQNSTDNDFGNFENGSFMGYKWNDRNGDGNTTGEPKLSGWTIFIDENANKALDDGEEYKVTDVNGEYQFTNVAPGTYSVCEVLQAGWVQTYPGNATTPQCQSVTISMSGEKLSAVKARSFGNQARGTLTVIKNVVNNNGGEKTYADFSFTVQASASQTPNVDGTYSFIQDGEDADDGKRVLTNVPAGTYAIAEVEANTMGYTTSYSYGDAQSCAQVVVPANGNATCTITNDDDAPSVTVTKRVLNLAGDAEPEDFTLYLDETEVTSGQTYTSFDAGSYVVSESDLDGYQLVQVQGDCAWGEDDVIRITLTIGGTHNCVLVNAEIPNPSIAVEKYGPDFAYEGDEVDYYFYVTNTGNLDLDGVEVLDDIAGEATFVMYWIGNDDDMLEVGETWLFMASYTIPEGEQGPVINTVEACADVVLRVIGVGDDIFDESTRIATLVLDDEVPMPPLLGQEVCAEDSHELEVWNPAINVVKTGPAEAVAGSTVTYTFTVTNTGDVPLGQISVLDSITGEGEYVSGDENEDGSLDLEETWIFTDTYTIPLNQTANVVNTVEVCGMSYPRLEFNDESVLARVAVDLQDDAVVEDEELGREVCAEDTHTLTVPQVLGDSIVVKPPVVLAQTGSSNIWQALFGLVLIAGAIASTRLTQKTTTR